MEHSFNRREFMARIVAMLIAIAIMFYTMLCIAYGLFGAREAFGIE
jgi:hypothetical protein